jgi:hypothetical protein
MRDGRLDRLVSPEPENAEVHLVRLSRPKWLETRMGQAERLAELSAEAPYVCLVCR